MLLYHGSRNVVRKPVFGQGNPRNDYGLGFYCTQDHELAMEWASKEEGQAGYCNSYEIDLSGLNVLNLADYSVLHWITLLVQNRTFTIHSPIAKEGKNYLVSHFALDLTEYDIVRGYRADDSYFAFADAFLKNTISIQRLKLALVLGDLGEQIVLISEKAFDRLRFLKAVPVSSDVYFHLRQLREHHARKAFLSNKEGTSIKDPLYLSDILKGMSPNDPRLR